MKLGRTFLNTLLLVLLVLGAANGQDFKKSEAKIKEYKQWLDSVGAKGARYWVRLDSRRRPQRLYVGEGFDKADYTLKERFVEIFSHYLAGHPEKFALIDLFDGPTGAPIGEFGWGGFKLYPNYGLAREPARKD